MSSTHQSRFHRRRQGPRSNRGFRWPNGATCPHCGLSETVSKLAANPWGRDGIIVANAVRNSPCAPARFTSARISRCTNGYWRRI